MVRNEMFADTRLDERPRPGSEEPELGLRSAPRPPDPLLGTEPAGSWGQSSPPDPEPSRAPTTSAALPVGGLLYLALVGLIAAATIGIFFGAGFLLLVHAGKEPIADTGAGDRRGHYSDARRDLEGPPAPRESAASNSAAAVAPPSSALAQPTAMAEVPPPQQSEAVASPPGASTNDPPARTALEPEPASGSPGSPSSEAPVAGPAPFSAADVPASGAAGRLPAHGGRSHHRQTASRHWHPRSGYNAPSLTPPQAAQSGPFDRLLTVLTGRSGLLTPPRAQ
jgi:hypothetical protein